MSDQKKIFPFVLHDRMIKKESTLTKETISSQKVLHPHQNIAQDHQMNLSGAAFNQIVCPICCSLTNDFCAVGQCGHCFCRVCCFGYINERIKSNTKLICPQESCEAVLWRDGEKSSKYEYFFQILHKKQRKKLLKYLKRLQKGQTKNKCKKCIYSDETKQKKMQLCKQCSEQELNLPDNIKKCFKCEKLLEKTKGCNHVKCTCGYQFCFLCNHVWTDDHLCQNRIVVRTGCSWVACGLFKILIGIPVVVFMTLIWLTLAIALCLISAFLAGLMIFLYGLDYMAKSNYHDCLKLLFLITLFIFLPVTWSISALPGFFIPIINICYKEKLILDPNTLENLTIRIFSCLRILTLI